MNLKSWQTGLVIVLVSAGATSVFGAPGMISTTVSPPGPFTVGDTFRVAFALSGYTDTTEIDGYNFHVAFDPLLSFVSGSVALNDAPGANENWLRLAPQDGVGASPLLTDSTVLAPGVVDVSVCDLRLSSTRGTSATASFLYSFDLMADSAGTAAIVPAPGAGTTVFFDTNFSPAGVPSFGGAIVRVVPRVRLSIVRLRFESKVTISWVDPGTAVTLQGAGAVTGPWQDIVLNATSPYSETIAGGPRFFRLKIP